MNGPLVYLHRPSCHCEATGSGAAGQILASCPSCWVSVDEGGGGGGVSSRSPMKSRLCLPVSMTAALSQYSAVGRPLHLKTVPSGVSEPLAVFLQLLLRFIFFLHCPCVCFVF
ncbi:hypothetical protein XENOCAPTIV_025188 [Xenoophorus captivus]|uniref:Uncharacterized protein n=2 Tax=Goodeidae TaxID=28758 RepID=A0ABV0R1Z7_9TELE